MTLQPHVVLSDKSSRNLMWVPGTASALSLVPPRGLQAIFHTQKWAIFNEKAKFIVKYVPAEA